jgi:hypothetical protein
MLPRSDCPLLVRTDFTSDEAWQQVRGAAQATYEDGFQAYIAPVRDPAFDSVPWQVMKAALPPNDHGALVLFVADRTAADRVGWDALAAVGKNTPSRSSSARVCCAGPSPMLSSRSRWAASAAGECWAGRAMLTSLAPRMQADHRGRPGGRRDQLGGGLPL